MTDTAKFAITLKDKFSGPAKRARRNSRDLHGSMSKLGGALKTVGVGLGLAGAAAAAAAYPITKTAIAADSMINALDRLTHGQGRAAFQEIGSMAADLGLDIDKTRKSYAHFLKLQFPEAQAKKLISMGADMQALGNSAEDVQGIFRALGQIRSKGRLQGEELLQLAERGVSQGLIYEALARNRGMKGSAKENVAKLQGLQQAGQISSDEFFVAFEEAINKKLGQTEVGESAKQFAAKTMEGQLNRLKEKTKLGFETLSRIAGDGLKTGLAGAMRVFDTFAKSAEGKKTLDMLITGFKKLGGFLKLALPLVAEMGTALITGLAEGFSVFSQALGTSAAEGKDWVAVLRDTAIPIIKFLGQAIGATAGAFTMGVKVIGYAVAGITMSLRGLGLMAEAAYGWGRDIVMGLVNGIGAFMGMIKSKAVQMGQAVKDGITGVLGINSPSKVMHQFGEWTGEGFQNGMDKTMPDVGQRLPGSPRVKSAAASMGSRSMNVGDISISVDGGGDARETAQETWSVFRRNMDAWLSQTGGEMGAVA